MDGKWMRLGSRQVYRVPIMPNCRIVEHLGAVKPRRDGRWNWWAWPSRFHKEWQGANNQGVATGEQEAKRKVEALRISKHQASIS
jgi:hypothetical protein